MRKRRVLGSLRASVASRDELRLRLGQQQEVARLGQLALTDVSGQELLDEACLTLAAELRTGFASVLELLPDRRAFVLRAGVGWPADQFGSQSIPDGARSHAGYTLTSSGPTIMRDAARESRFEISAEMAAQGITSGLTAIIGWDERTYGVLGAHTSRRRDFSGQDVTFVEAVAHVLALALRRRAAEGEAEQSHRVLEAVIEGTPDHVYVKDLDGRFLAVNARAAERVGLTRNELLGRTLHEVMPRDIADALAETDRLVLERGMLTVEETVTLARRDSRRPHDERPVSRPRRHAARDVRDRTRHHGPQGAGARARSQRGAVPARPGRGARRHLGRRPAERRHDLVRRPPHALRRRPRLSGGLRALRAASPSRR